jgi:hypothetical protein
MQPQQNNAPSNTPTQPQPTGQPQVMYVARPAIPEAPVVSEEAERLHNESVAAYPFLNLSEGEYVISAVRRHLIGLLSIWSVVILFGLLVIGILVFVSNGAKLGVSFPISAAQITPLLFILLIFMALGGCVATYIYRQNKFFLTNESVIQEIQTSLFSRREQTVSLGNIEDASFKQQGFFQMVFNYGSIRLSTQGDETTYRFNFVANPRQQITKLNNAVESFKNGRPILDF